MIEPVSERDGSTPAGWTRWRVEEPPVSILVSESTAVADRSDDEANGSDADETARRAIRAGPELGTGADGAPACSVTLVLERQPSPGEESIRPLIDRATLRFDATLSVPERALRALSCELGAPVESLYVRETTVSLVADEGEPAANDVADENYVADATDAAAEDEPTATGRVLDTAAVTGPNPTASLGGTLERDDALTVLEALSGEDRSLEVRAAVRYRPPAPARTVTLRGSWSAIYDGLDQRVPEAGEFDRETLRDAVITLIERGVLSVETAGRDESTHASEPIHADRSTRAGESTLEAAVDLFVDRAGLVLRRVDAGSSGAGGERYVLGSRPPTGTTFGVTESGGRAPERTLRLVTPLATLLGDGLDGTDLDAVVSAVALDGDAVDGVSPLLKRVTAGGRASRSDGDRPSPLALDGSTLTAVEGIVTPSDRLARRPAGPLVTGPQPTDRPKPQGGGYEPAEPELRHLPIVDQSDGSMGPWPDRIDDDRAWYAPTFEPVEPGDTGGFRFEFERHGTTADGDPGLRGTLSFDLERGRPDRVPSAPDRLDPVPVSDLSVDVFVPYEDADEGTRTRKLSADVDRSDGTLSATVELQNRWVRLCYGALALSDFQDRPPEVVVSYAFEAYVEIRYELYDRRSLVGQETDSSDSAAGAAGEGVELAASDSVRVDPRIVGTKRATLPVAGGERAGEDGASRSGFDPTTGRLTTSLGTLDLASGRRRDGGRDAGGGRSETDDPEADERADDRERVDALARVRRAGIEALDRPGSTGADPSRSAARASRTDRGGTASAVLASDVAVRPQLRDSDMSILPVPVYEVQSFERSVRHPLAYPCDEHGGRYRERTADGTVAVGCRDAFALGETDVAAYAELDDLRTDRYRVYQRLAQPNRFLVVPSRYRIGRREPGANRAYRPTAICYAVLDPEDPLDSTLTFEAGLQPELPPYERLALRERFRDRLAEREPNGNPPDPVVEYPTTAADAVTVEWAIDEAFAEPTVVAGADHLRASASIDLVQFEILREMLETNGIGARATFHLPDDSTVASDLELELASMTGPWTGGPLAIDGGDESVAVANRVGTDVSVESLRWYDGDRRTAEIPIETRLAPDESTTVRSRGVGETADPVAVYEAHPAGDVTLETSRIYVEDVTTNVVFVTDFDPAARGVEAGDVEVHARLRDVEGTRFVSLGGGSASSLSGSVTFTLPLTRYLDSLVLEFRTATRVDGDVLESGWHERDLRTHGHVVPLAWELLAGETTRTSRSAPVGRTDASSEQTTQRGREASGASRDGIRGPKPTPASDSPDAAGDPTVEADGESLGTARDSTMEADSEPPDAPRDSTTAADGDGSPTPDSAGDRTTRRSTRRRTARRSNATDETE